MTLTLMNCSGHWVGVNSNTKRLESAAVMMYKSLHGMTPEKSFPCKSFSYSGTGLWNSLSSDLCAETSLHDFKFNLRHHSFE